MRKYVTFSVPIKKEHDNCKTTRQKLNFIDSFRIMSTLLSSLVDILSPINKKECKAYMQRKDIKSECDFIALENDKLR